MSCPIGMTKARADARPRGNIESRGDSLRIRVYAGPDPVTSKPVYLRETMPGTKEAARRKARRALNWLVAEAEKTCQPSSAISLGQVIDEWLKVAEHEDSTRETYLGYIERTIKPALGSMSIAKLSVRPLETLYAELRRCRVRCDRKPFIEHKAEGEHDCAGTKIHHLPAALVGEFPQRAWSSAARLLGWRSKLCAVARPPALPVAC